MYFYLHLVDLYGKCRQIYHTWILWESTNEDVQKTLSAGLPQWQVLMGASGNAS